MKEDKHLWEQFVRLGERIGDGDLDSDEQWMKKEYKRLSRILIPEIKEAEKVKREKLDEKIKEYIISKKCLKCQGDLKQTRKGSKTLICLSCNAKFKIKTSRR